MIILIITTRVRHNENSERKQISFDQTLRKLNSHISNLKKMFPFQLRSLCDNLILNDKKTFKIHNLKIFSNC